MTRKLFIVLCSCFLFVFAAESVAQDTYQTPSQELVNLVDGARNPSVSISPDQSTLLLQEQPALPSIEEIAQPQLRLAGMRINPNTNGTSRPGYVTGFTLRDLETGTDREITGIPDGARMANVSWAPDGSRFAFLMITENSLDLWLADVDEATVSKLSDYNINNTYYGSPFFWTRDGSSLIAKIVPENRGNAPQTSTIPAGPVIQENIGEATPARTYQDLLQNQHDEDLFDYYFTSELVEISVPSGDHRKIGEAAIYRSVSLSPDGNYLLVNLTEKPYSYRVPASRFPQHIQILDRDGTLVHTFAELPLADNVPIAFSATTTGPRSVSWRNDAPATLAWVEALDEGDPAVDVPFRDRVRSLEAPFDGEPINNFDMEYRYSGIQWSEDGFALVSEYWRDSRHRRTWKINPDNPAQEAELIFDLSTEDRYSDPGSPEMKRSEYGTWVLDTKNNGSTLLMTGIGATPEGNRPFLSEFNLNTKENTEIWRSEAPYYERIVTLLDDGEKLITLRESVDEQPNYFIRNLNDQSVSQLTDFEHPTPELREVTKEFIQYEREDGVQLSATLYLPPGYDAATDGPLPVLVWAYPREFRSAAAAGQVADSPYRFASLSYWGPHFALTQGFAVVENATMPIVGEGDQNPNDTFVEQLITSSEAVLGELERRGVGDPNRAAIGGHSYGAFMTANLLAHSRLFKAGIARSGAYNRTLTPFGFQAEPRNFWESSEIYLSMSPFMHADGIKDPILFIHGTDDNNSGTFPMQSERMYAAVSGLGGTARLVMLPEESHGYSARESILHMLWEQSEWINTFVRDL